MSKFLVFEKNDRLQAASSRLSASVVIIVNTAGSHRSSADFFSWGEVSDSGKTTGSGDFTALWFASLA